MRISHNTLDDCLRNPRQWFISTRSSSSHPYKMGYERVLRLSIYHCHKNSADEARRYMSEKITRHNFRNAQRVSEIENGLESYIAWAVSERLRNAGVQININLSLGFLELRGEISRIDVIDSGYRAVLLGTRTENWQSQLRMPLIQSAVSLTYARPAQEVEVGFQELDGANLQTVSYGSRQLKAAQEEFRVLGNAVRRISTSS